MFLLYINKLKEISTLGQMNLTGQTAYHLPHEAIVGRLDVPPRLKIDLGLLLGKATLESLTGQQFIDLGNTYRQQLKQLIDEIRDIPEALSILTELEDLYHVLAIYERYATLELPKRLADAGYPLPQSDFPHNRDKQRYLQLHYPRLPHQRQNKELVLSLDELPAQHVIVDAGLGDGLALAQLKTEKNLTIGFSMNPIDEKYSNQIDSLCYSSIPHGEQARMLFTELRGRVDLVLETYGPSTYAKDTIHALLYLGLLLKPGGQAKILISSITGEEEDQSPIGFIHTRQQISKLFKHEFGLDVMITRTFIDSAVQSDLICKDFHVSIHRSEQALARTESLDDLFSVLDRYLGQAQYLPKRTTWGGFAGGFKIQGRCYTQDNNIQLYSPDWRTHLNTISVHYEMNVMMNVRFHLQFDNELSCSYFSAQISEFLIIHPQTNWRMATHAEATTLVYGYHELNKMQLAEQACFQLRAAMVIPGMENINVKALSEIQGQFVLFKRGTNYQPALFKASQLPPASEACNKLSAHGKIV